jgi:hypothetical protein
LNPAQGGESGNILYVTPLRVCLAKIFMIKSRDDFHFLTLYEAD